MAYTVPPMLVNVAIAWGYLVVLFFGLPCFKKNSASSEMNKKNVSKMLRDKYNALGPMSFHELAVFVLFLMVVCLWLFRDPRFMPGWGEQIKGVKVGDSTAAMLTVVLLFVVPKDISFLYGSKCSKHRGKNFFWDLHSII